MLHGKQVIFRTRETISKSKRQLAQLLIEAGVTQFPEGANWAAQDKCNEDGVDRAVSFFGGTHKPARCMYFNYTGWRRITTDTTFLGYDVSVALPTLIPNWHQTVLSRDEFDQIVAETVVSSEPNSGGWIEWCGGECPVDRGTMVDVKYRCGEYNIGVTSLMSKGDDGFMSGLEYKGMLRSATDWSHDSHEMDIIAYRLHNPEQAEPQYCESVTRSIPEPTAAPTLDQLLQDWRYADDYAKRKQAEADEAAAMRDERWQAVQARAGEMRVTVGWCEPVVGGDDGWVEWVGGEQPVEDGTMVVLKMRDGHLWMDGVPRRADDMGWGHDGDDSDIVSYRLARP